MMLDLFIKLCDYLWWPAFVIGVMVLLLVIRWVFKIWKFTEKIKTVDKVNNNIDTISTNISVIKWTINFILSRIWSIESWHAFAQTQSPTQLTEKWRNLLGNTIKEIIDQKREDIKAIYPNLLVLTNPLDIENYAKEIAPDIYNNFTDIAEKDRIKLALFKEWADLGVLSLITWIYVRTKILEERNIFII